ncbi:MAG: SRPBCC domain-containing protein [Bacteroidia bacterium]|nr:SRPBCC domain-containing protein [Bacteroidia bacterium]
MKNTLLMDFSVDRATSTVHVKKQFQAPQNLVWDAFTKQEILDQWWAPLPWMSRTKSMEFREGGRRLYAMVGPEGEEHWALADFKSITPKSNFQFADAFCDAEGKINMEWPSSGWNVNFDEVNGITMVSIEIRHASLQDLEKIIELGFKEGFIMALDNLTKLLSLQK